MGRALYTDPSGCRAWWAWWTSHHRARTLATLWPALGIICTYNMALWPYCMCRILCVFFVCVLAILHAYANGRRRRYVYSLCTQVVLNAAARTALCAWWKNTMSGAQWPSRDAHKSSNARAYCTSGHSSFVYLHTTCDGRSIACVMRFVSSEGEGEGGCGEKNIVE